MVEWGFVSVLSVCVINCCYGPPETLRPLKNDLLRCVQLWQELATHHMMHISISVVMFDPGEVILPWRNECYFSFSFFSSSLSFVATTVISFKSWFLNKIEASWLWQRQWQSCQPAYDRLTFKALCRGESGVRAGWRQQRLNTVKVVRHLLSKFDFLLDLGHVPSVTSNVHSPLTSSLVKDWPSSCQLKHCCECHTCSYQGGHKLP